MYVRQLYTVCPFFVVFFFVCCLEFYCLIIRPVLSFERCFGYFQICVGSFFFFGSTGARGFESKWMKLKVRQQTHKNRPVFVRFYPCFWFQTIFRSFPADQRCNLWYGISRFIQWLRYLFFFSLYTKHHKKYQIKRKTHDDTTFNFASHITHIHSTSASFHLHIHFTFNSHFTEFSHLNYYR